MTSPSRKNSLRARSRGFTLIEFMIALAISLIVAAAAVSVYLYTNRLNQLAELNLKVQEELRQVSRLISQDASLAGSFGCLTLSSLFAPENASIDNRFNREFHVFFSDEAKQNAGAELLVFDRPGEAAKSGNQNFGVTLMPQGKIKLAGFTATSPALVFYYGEGSSGLAGMSYGAAGDEIDRISFIDADAERSLSATAAAGGYLALASCRALNIFRGKKGGDLHFTRAELGDVRLSFEDEPNKQQITEINLLRYVVHAYVMGTFKGQSGLYLLRLNENGTWGAPVLLSAYVTALIPQFIFASTENDKGEPLGCPQATNNDVLENQNGATTLEALNRQFNQYYFYSKNNATFTQATLPTNPKGAQGIDLARPLEEETRYQPPVALDITLTIRYPHVSRPFGRGEGNRPGTSAESIKMNVNEASDTEREARYRIFSVIKGGNQCANRNLLD